MAEVFGPLYQAGDDGENQLACAAVNATLLQREGGRLVWHNDRTCSCVDQVYWKARHGGHGWMCPGCYGLTQLG